MGWIQSDLNENQEKSKHSLEFLFLLSTWFLHENQCQLEYDFSAEIMFFIEWYNCCNEIVQELFSAV